MNCADPRRLFVKKMDCEWFEFQKDEQQMAHFEVRITADGWVVKSTGW